MQYWVQQEEQESTDFESTEDPHFPACRERYRHLAEESVDEESERDAPSED